MAFGSFSRGAAESGFLEPAVKARSEGTGAYPYSAPRRQTRLSACSFPSGSARYGVTAFPAGIFMGFYDEVSR
jgi:hypothetical protein